MNPADKPPSPLDNPILIHPKKDSPLLTLSALGTALGVDINAILPHRPSPEQAAKYARQSAADYHKAPDNTPVTCPGCRRTLKRKNAVQVSPEVWACKRCSASLTPKVS